MANKLMRRLGFAGIADQLSISGPSLSYTSTASAAPTSAPGGSSFDPWAGVASTAIATAGQVATSVWGYHPEVSQEPFYPGAGAQTPYGGAGGTIDSKLLLIGGIAVVAILVFGMAKKSA